MERNDSGETIESPFASNLNTPIDGPSVSPFDSLFEGSEVPKKFGEQPSSTPPISMTTARDYSNEITLQYRNRPSGSLVLPTCKSLLDDQTATSVPSSPRLLLESDSDSFAFISDCPLPGATSLRADLNQEPTGNLSEVFSTLVQKSSQINGINTPNDNVVVCQGVSNAAILESFAASFELSNGARSSLENAAHILLLVVGFLPWCAAVGGCMLLFPDHLELVTFGPGYLCSPRDIHRFAYWINYGTSHVILFLTLLGILIWQNPFLGLILAAGVLARFAVVWSDFGGDPSVPLGQDDRQTLYILASSYIRGAGTPRIRQTQSGKYFLAEHFDVN